MDVTMDVQPGNKAFNNWQPLSLQSMYVNHVSFAL